MNNMERELEESAEERRPGEELETLATAPKIRRKFEKLAASSKALVWQWRGGCCRRSRSRQTWQRSHIRLCGLRQLVGGVDTLFGEASQFVQGYAEMPSRPPVCPPTNIWKPSRLFGKSYPVLGGDTAKAAQVADMAITDSR
jgi:hypothetical protein